MMPAGKACRICSRNSSRSPTNEPHRFDPCGSADPAHPAPATPRRPRGSARPRQAHRHVLVAIVLNRPGVLNRVASLMRARNFNIETLAVSHTDSRR